MQKTTWSKRFMQITMYTTNVCSSCRMVKQYLATKGLKYSEINIQEQPDKASEAFNISGQMSVPVVVINRGDESPNVIVGYNLAKLAPAVSV